MTDIDRAITRLNAFVFEETGALADMNNTPEVQKLLEENIAVFNLAIEALQEKQERRWIPVSERLPEPGMIVLVHQIYSWLRFEDGAAITIGRLRPQEPGCSSYWEFQYYRPDFKTGTVMDNDIICPGNEYVTAWQPLPEPWEGECK